MAYEVKPENFTFYYTSTVKSRLTMASQFIAEFTTPRPNWWFRLWQFLLLGWRWEKVSK